MSPALASLLADLILALHVVVVLFVLGVQALVLVGGWRDWRWVRLRWLRVLHLAAIVFIAAQAWLGRLCPLTEWEQRLRGVAGQRTYDESFIEHWLSRLLFFEAPWWVFVAAYSALAALVLWTWWRIPPAARRIGRQRAAQVRDD